MCRQVPKALVALKLPGAGPGFKSRFSMDFGGFQNLIRFEHVMIIPIIMT
jgi:hypothetical protein